ncbi:lipopolysaccharide transport periplasmic protein LptA [Ghiorsea bivora]|uniref:lipopolysaccharide transport periplasmic protein LptA n=1 Tax=Ghiorsea bivora TaxID=1485545 RepID=UPI000571CA00|nr:lipopolysaccharide transport periplasmic protein LptA [Ghiorsea bivora]
MKNRLLFFGLCFALLHFSPIAYAETMTVDADRFELFQEDKRADFYGHVVVHRHDMVMKADKVKVWYQEIDGKNELKSLDATGHVMITTKVKQGSADRATFEAGSELLVLTGHAQVKDENSVLEGEVIEYHTATENIKVLKGKSGKQVQFTFGEEAK